MGRKRIHPLGEASVMLAVRVYGPTARGVASVLTPPEVLHPYSPTEQRLMIRNLGREEAARRIKEREEQVRALRPPTASDYLRALVERDLTQRGLL